MLEAFINKLTEVPDNIQFSDTIGLIDILYQFEPTAFRTGELRNEAGQNSGSCKIFAFARRHDLSSQQTLACFGAYYRDDVLKHPQDSNHQNIRNFMQTGWAGIEFYGDPLSPR
ncbi:MAG TPA: HopJ type III effector protein [Spongiibacteraceae bacterium]|nr:HopJ type III effector protein [Spongiibacteraceae bacterium]